LVFFKFTLCLRYVEKEIERALKEKESKHKGIILIYCDLLLFYFIYFSCELVSFDRISIEEYVAECVKDALKDVFFTTKPETEER
jgi:hypothetical protein